jgi:tape measure domain-containing protein
MANFSELVVKLELQQAAFQKGMDQSARQLQRLQTQARAAQGSLNSLEGAMKAVAAAAAAAAAVFGAFKGAEAIVKSADAIRNLQGSFNALLGDSTRAADMLQRVFGIVERTGAPLEAVGGAAQRLTIALRDMGASNTQIERITETFIKLGKIGGSSAAETAAALQQLGQALASGKLAGDELRSIRENAPLVAEAIAKAMGVSSGALKQLGEDGKLTADVVANALLSAAADANAAFAKLPQTFEQSMNRMEAQASRLALSFDNLGGLSKTMITTIDFITDAMKRWEKEMEPINGQLSATAIIVQSVNDFAKLVAVAFVAISFAVEQIVKRTAFWAEQLKLLANFDWKGIEESTARWRAQLDAAADAANRTIEALLRGKALDAGATSLGTGFGTGTGSPWSAAAQNPALKPPPGGGGGGGGSKGKSEAEREIEALRKRGEALAAQVSAQNAYNQKLEEYRKLLDAGAISDVTFARAVEQAKEQLYAAGDAVRASIDPLFALNREILKLNELFVQGAIDADTWAEAIKQAEKKANDAGKKQKTWQDYLNQGIEGTAEAMGQFLGDIVSGAETVEQAFTRMVQTLITQLGKLLAEFAAKKAAEFIISSILGGGSPGVSGSAAPSLALAAMPATWNAAATLAPSARAGFGATGMASGGGMVGGTTSGNPWSVVINNNAPGVDVSARPRSDGALEVTVERVRALLTQDVVRGGNSFSRGLETAYGLGRGR